MTTSAADLRRAFTSFFVDRAHTLVPSSGLIPHHPLAPLFTNAGMNQFLPYLLGEEAPPWPRATSVQKCVRIRGKHDDIELIGRTSRHLSFFEMLGNFSFGDYFKESAIPWHWELLTEVLGIDGDRLWVTVHLDDDEAAEIWRETVGIPSDRIQRLGEDNFWEMAETGPCGPSSELFVDKGPEHGEDGGPLHGGKERFVEIANLVFMQYDRQASRALAPLPRRSIDTGSGLDRILPVLQGVDSVFDTDVLRPIVDAAARVTGRTYGTDDSADISLRILADHARSMTFLVSDGVFPSNEDRGYVLRRIIRRAVRHAFALGVEREITPALVEATAEVMGEAYPELVRNLDFVLGVVTREEAKFRQTLRSGSAILEEELAGVEAAGQGTLSGSVAFRLHDTFGFPLELTLEVAGEHGVEVDRAAFEQEMEAQRQRARAAQPSGGVAGEDPQQAAAYRDLLEQFGITDFTGYVESESEARVLAVLERSSAGDEEPVTVEVFLDRTPFYAESGGQLGDTGTIDTETGTAQVVDTTYALPGLRRHLALVTRGHLTAGQFATARIDADRREAIRRNHTGTHILHWALREVLGQHVKQAGSLVAPDRLRFDFSHYGPLTPDELAAVEDAANAEVLANQPVRAYETTQEEAQRVGAIAFFGEKYGEVVRVVEAGRRSVELCGGTHVGALGTIGPIKIVSEGSIGSNLRRIEAVTGTGSLQRIREEEEILGRAATLLRVAPPEVPERVEHVLDENRALSERVKALRRRQAVDTARSLAAGAADGVIVARVDGTSRQDLQDLAVAVRDQPGVRAVVLGSAPEAGGVALVAAVAKDSGLVASDLIAEAARTVGGGGGKSPEIAVAGGRDPSRLDEALEQARRATVGS
ncbi:MAG TPA: alanine--tRNA ligase [Acidimicrobiales bacterium]|jgi:alanyl-tRNA synthetase